MAVHQGMYNVAREDGRREVMAGLQQQQQQKDAVGRLVAGVQDAAGQQGFAAGEESGANKAMNAILAQQAPQAGLGNEQAPQGQPQFTEQDVMQIAQWLQSGEITEEIYQQMPGAVDMAIQMIQQAQQQQALQGASQAGLSPQSV